MTPDIIKVIPHKDYTVSVYFKDKKSITYDMKDDLNEGIFKQLKDINVFMNTCKILNGTLAWDIGGNNDTFNCIDICPDLLYELAKDE